MGSSGRLTSVGLGRPRQGGRGRAPLVLVLVHQLLVDYSVHVILQTRGEKPMRGRKVRQVRDMGGGVILIRIRVG